MCCLTNTPTTSINPRLNAGGFTFLVKEKGYSFHDLLMKAKAKFDWHIDAVQLGAQLLQAQDVKDFPRMLKKIDHQDWQEFFLKEAKKLEKEVFDG